MNNIPKEILTPIWVTKFALTKGIQKHDAFISFDGYAQYVPNPIKAPLRRVVLAKDDYALTVIEARWQATIKRDERAKSLLKELERIQKIVF